MTTPLPTFPDWFIIRALLCCESDAPELADADLPLYRWLLIKQGWAIGPVAMSQKTGLPISADIEAITLDGFDWGSLLANRQNLAAALEQITLQKLKPSTWLLREILLNNQIEQLKTPAPPARQFAVTPPRPQLAPNVVVTEGALIGNQTKKTRKA